MNDERRGAGNHKPELRSAFTLIETLVVVALVALLLSILLPSLSSARSQARAAVCASNVRQVATANHLYAHDHGGRVCPGAARMIENLHRWHGARDDPSAPFDSARGPLVPYLGAERQIRDCPDFRDYVTHAAQAFEIGSGGYGYNNAFVGTQLRHVAGPYYIVESDEGGVGLERIRAPANTLMFADSGFAADELIEYSFAEPRFFPTTATRADPSIHFRHRSHANISWCDGHVDRRPRSFSYRSGLYTADPARLGLGWFGTSDDNRFFDLD